MVTRTAGTGAGTEIGQTSGVTSHLKFGWLSPVIGNRWSDHQPIVMYQDQHILPTALPHFDSVWIADHFYGFEIGRAHV